MLRSVLGKTVYEHRRGLVFWSLGLAGLVYVIVLVYPSVRDKPELNRLVQDYPDVLKAFIGGGAAVDYLSAAGYLNADASNPYIKIYHGNQSREFAGQFTLPGW